MLLPPSQAPKLKIMQNNGSSRGAVSANCRACGKCNNCTTSSESRRKNRAFVGWPDDHKPSKLGNGVASTKERCSQSYCIRKTTKYTLFALGVFLGQIAISVSLKRYGFIERDFNEVVAERLLPHLNNLEQTVMMSMPQVNESLYWIRNFNQTYIAQGKARPGYELSKKGAHAKYPIVMVPGFVTSALELWQGKECARSLFRQKLWGGVGMVQNFLRDRACVMEHLALDHLTGKDPENIRVRAGTGFEAADYFAANYWVWSKLLENLADIGYDGNYMSMEAYDWRLSFPMLEERDGYLTRLKYRIESLVKFSGKKVVLTSHSMGCSLVHYFFVWVTTVEKKGGGGGGKDWVDKHIHAYINIAGAQLGAAKSASSLLSGEMSDTVFVGAAGNIVEQFLGRKVRKDLWISWGSLWTLLPKGGAAIWDIGADLVKSGLNFGKGEPRDDYEAHMIVLADEEKLMKDEVESSEDSLESLSSENPIIRTAIEEFSGRTNQTVDDITNFLRRWGGGWGPDLASAKWHSFDAKEKPSRATWHDISRTPLPKAPNMKIYCLYGHGLETERGYHYKRHSIDTSTDGKGQNKSRLDPPFILDTSVNDPARNITHGVRYADGDGSVPLISLGYMCADGWRMKENGLNPSNAKVITREYLHRPELLFEDPMRGGPYSAEHVDIMGNLNMMTDFLKIVSDFELDSLVDSFSSDILGIAERIAQHPKGGLPKRRRSLF